MEKSRKGGVITREAKYLLGEEAAFEFIVETLLSLSFFWMCNYSARYSSLSLYVSRLYISCLYNRIVPVF